MKINVRVNNYLRQNNAPLHIGYFSRDDWSAYITDKQYKRILKKQRSSAKKGS